MYMLVNYQSTKLHAQYFLDKVTVMIGQSVPQDSTVLLSTIHGMPTFFTLIYDLHDRITSVFTNCTHLCEYHMIQQCTYFINQVSSNVNLHNR